MGAGPKLDSVGVIKLVTLDEALTKLQGLHGIVERMAVEVKNEKSISGLGLTLKRQATPLQGQLKMQFQLIADLVSGMLLISGRGGPDRMKLRAYREAVAQIRTQIEISIIQVKEKHAEKDPDEAEGKETPK